MKTVWVVIVAMLVLAAGYFVLLGMRSKTGSPAGLESGRLSHCPSKPNCVSSEAQSDPVHYVAPLMMPSQPLAASMQQVREVIEAAGGLVVQQQDGYLAATFTSRLLGFVDDLEVSVDNARQRLHVRSASRVGHSDFGVNRKRVEQLRTDLKARGWP